MAVGDSAAVRMGEERYSDEWCYWELVAFAGTERSPGADTTGRTHPLDQLRKIGVACPVAERSAE